MIPSAIAARRMHGWPEVDLYIYGGAAAAVLITAEKQRCEVIARGAKSGGTEVLKQGTAPLLRRKIWRLNR